MPRMNGKESMDGVHSGERERKEKRKKEYMTPRCVDRLLVNALRQDVLHSQRRKSRAFRAEERDEFVLDRLRVRASHHVSGCYGVRLRYRQMPPE